MRRAIDGGEYQPLEEYLSGPSALTFVQGDISAVAKALRDFSRTNPHLVIKGGLADGSLLSSSDLAALADLPPREVLLARLAGALAAPMQQMAGLLKALPQNMAYGISALIEQKGGVDEVAAAGARHRPRPPEAQPADDTPTRRDIRRDGSTGRGRGRGRCAGGAGGRRGSRTRSDRGGRGHRRSRGGDRRAGRRVDPNQPQDQHQKTEGKKGRPGRWQP